MIYIENNLEKQDLFIPRNDGSGCYVSPYDKGYQDGYEDGLDDCGAGCTLQEKEVTVTATTQTVRPDDGYVGMDVVNINASQFVLEKYTEGYHDGEENGTEEQKSKLTSTAFTENGVYRREDGWNEVEVVVEQTGTTCNLQSKPIVVTADTETIVPDQGYDGFDSVDIDATSYGQDKYNEGYQDGYDKGQEDCPDCPEPVLQNKSVVMTGDTETVYPDSGYDGMSGVSIDATTYGQDRYDEGFTDGQASVPPCPPCPPCPEIESAVTYGIGSGFTGATITPSSGYDGMAEVTITDNGYGQEKYNEGFTDGQTDILSGLTDTTITQNGTYSNPSGWSGVTVAVPQTGSSCNLQQKAITLESGDTSPWTISPDAGYDGMSGVTITDNGYGQEKYSEGHSDGYDEGYQDGLDDCSGGTCNLEAVSYAIPTGFTGTTITPSSGYDGMSSVAITDGGYGQEKYDEGYQDGYEDASGSTCNLQDDKTAQMTATTQTFYPDVSGVTITGIQTDGYSWFDTGVYPNIDTKIEVSFTPLDRTFIPHTYQKNWGGIIGAQNGDDDNATFQVRFSAETSTILGRVGDGGDVGRFNTIYGTKYTATLDKNAFVLNGSQVPTNATSEDTCNYTIYISAINNGVNHHTWVNHRATPNIFHEVKIWQNNVLVRDYVPAINNDLPCLFDTVNNIYTYNIGSGTCSTVTGSTGSVYDGMTSITVDASGLCQDYYNSGVTVGENNIISGMSSTAITQNGNYTNSSGWSAVTVNVAQTGSSCNLQDRSVVMTATTQVVGPTSGYDGMSAVTIDGSNLYNMGLQSVVSSFFTANTTGYLIAYYYTETSRDCLITGYYTDGDTNVDGTDCFSSMSVNGGEWETPTQYKTLPAGWTQIRFQLRYNSLNAAFSHHYTPCIYCYMDALKAVSLPGSMTTGPNTFVDNQGVKILSLKWGVATGDNAPNLKTIFCSYKGSNVQFSNFPSNGALFIPEGQSSNYSGTLTNWTHIELF